MAKVMLPLRMLSKSSARRRVLPPAAGANDDADDDVPPLPPAVAAAAAAAADDDTDGASGGGGASSAAGADDDDDDDAALRRVAAVAEARAALDAPLEGGGDDGAVAGYEGGGTHDGAADDHAAELTANEIATTRAAAAAAARSAHGPNATVPLDAPPAEIIDIFSSVLGDAFHFMDRPKVPIHHEYKKGYFVALQEAWFAWNEERMEQVRKTLRTAGFTKEEIDAKLYYDVSWFRERAERVVLPPSKLYCRVRAVFELYGPMTDSASKAPLFNEAA